MNWKWIALFAGVASFIIGVFCGITTAHADPCYLPPGIPARVAPVGMDNYMWPPCEPYPPPPITTTECVFPDGNPDGSWCWHTEPNGKRYMRWRYHAR